MHEHQREPAVELEAHLRQAGAEYASLAALGLPSDARG